MKALFSIILFVLLSSAILAQQRFAFIHITTDDGVGLASNHVTSLYQDEKGFIWVGTANGLQRFDGSKFIQINTAKPGSDPLLYPRISQILPADSGKLILGMFILRQFGLFDPATFIYKKISLKPSRSIPASSEYRLWKDSNGEIYLNVQNFGILHLNKKENVFVEDHVFPIPNGWSVNLIGTYEDVANQRYWFGCDSGICIYDKKSRQMWYRGKNPANLPILDNPLLRDGINRIYIDHERKIWIFSYPEWGEGGQYRFCFDSTGSKSLKQDTIGLNHGPRKSAEYKHFYETNEGDLWIYGLNALLNYDKEAKRFDFIKSGTGDDNITIDYESVFQLLQDKDGNIWAATNQGIYYTAIGSTNSSVVNITYKNNDGLFAINDIIESADGNFLFASGRNGVDATDRFLNKIKIDWYTPAPPAAWTKTLKNATFETWSLCRQSTGNIWVGCNSGVLMVRDMEKRNTEYFHPDVLNDSRIQYIAEDKSGQMWLATQGGRLVKYSNNAFEVVLDIGTVIYKIFFDNEGWLWLATRESGLYALDPVSGKIIQHYTVNGGTNSLYSNTGTDIEQLRNGLIVFAGGALHFIDKKSKKIFKVQYKDGLPSNTAIRLRMDKKGLLWIITSNGLCRYNPNNNHINALRQKRRSGICRVGNSGRL